MDSGAETVILRLRANFPKATSESSRRIISEEVLRFIKEGSGGEDQDISYLEDAIRNRLAGRTGASGRAERLAAKKSLFSNDDWSRISLYMAFMAREDARREAAADKARKKEVHGLLAGQVAVTAQRKLAEKEHKKDELKEVEESLQQWEKEEKARHQHRQAAVQKLRSERQVQLKEQANRRMAAAELRRRGEEELTVRIALDVKHQMEAEAASKAKAKSELKAFLLSNEVNKKIKEEEAERERQQDVRYMQQQAAQLDKQERERQQLLERVRAVQNRQAEDAAQRPPFKRWVAEEIIERQFQEKQAALDAEEARRKNVATDAAVRLRKDIGEQCGAREAERVAELQQKRWDLEKVMADLEVCRKTEKAVKQAELVKMREFKAELDQQIADNQVRRSVAAMTETERKLNAKLLREVDAAASQSGRIAAIRTL
ncbi:hypothetical protein D9Q98_009673 [Chlorella vulgaris]|uniref:Trichohyalin-plectin-homology domain-containing protein n=1 Tax=Chlorella vulgaris TaxID=3077 RepID=A0A9D4TES9_CHLVU|nr:hypothetical protein D9Q98_009673 [Chlorella vulgaris]